MIRYVLDNDHKENPCSFFKELQDIITVCEEDVRIAKESGGNPLMRMLREPAVRKAVLVGCTLQLFQQLSGINTG